MAVSFVRCADDVQIEANSLTAAVFDAPLLQFKDVDFVQTQPNGQTGLLRYQWQANCDLTNFHTGYKRVLMKV